MFMLFLIRKVDYRHIKMSRVCNIQPFFYICEKRHFSVKNGDIFLNFAQNIDRGYTLEPPH